MMEMKNDIFRIILCGCNGKMGKVIEECVREREDCRIVAGIDLNAHATSDYPVYSHPGDVEVQGDVIIDFSHPSCLTSLLDYAVQTHTPIVVATTGYTVEQVEQIKQAAEKTAVFFSFNMSLGINLLTGLAKKAAAVLGGQFDIEIVEKHHNQKVDAPSGTAIMLAQAINETLGNQYSYNYDRHSQRKKRDKYEIGMHSIRGGTIVGEHDVIFAGKDEIITLSHQAMSKTVFAVGAVNAAVFLSGKPAGLYDMSSLLAD